MPRIMIVDDDATIQMELAEYLTHMDYTVVGTAETGEGAIEMARETDPDLILMDVNLAGEMNGISAAQKIKEEMDIPIVFISGYGDPEYIEQAKEIEPFGYVMKPFDEKEIRAFIEIGLHKKAMELKLKKTNEQLEQTNHDLKQEIMERKQTEEALKESDSFFSQIFEQSTTSTGLYNPDGTINSVNNEFCKMFGVEEKVIINAGYNVFKDQATMDAGVTPLLREVFDEKKAKNWETIFDIDVASASTGMPTSRTGKIFIKVFGYPVLNRNGNLEYVVLQHYDITERKHLEEQVKQKLIALTQPEVEIGDLSLHDILGVDIL